MKHLVFCQVPFTYIDNGTWDKYDLIYSDELWLFSMATGYQPQLIL